MGIGVLVDEAAIAVITPAIYNLYLAEDFTVTVILFKAWVPSKAAKLLKVKVVLPLTVKLFWLVFPLLKQGDGNAGSVWACAPCMAKDIIRNKAYTFFTLCNYIV